MAAKTQIPNSFRQYMNDGTIDLDTNNIRCTLISNDSEFVATSTTWAGTTAKGIGDIIVPTVDNGHMYVSTTVGTTGSSEPSWPKNGITVADGTVVWIDANANIDVSQTVWVKNAGIWQATHDYSLNDLVRPTHGNMNGHYYKCTGDTGTSAGSEPTWPTGSGNTVVDGGITWTEQGINFAANEIVDSGAVYTDTGTLLTNTAMSYSGFVSKFDADDITWANSTITARFAILWKDGTANGIVNPLILMILLDDTPVDVVSSNSDFKIIWNDDGILNWSSYIN